MFGCKSSCVQHHIYLSVLHYLIKQISLSVKKERSRFETCWGHYKLGSISTLLLFVSNSLHDDIPLSTHSPHPRSFLMFSKSILYFQEIRFSKVFLATYIYWVYVDRKQKEGEFLSFKALKLCDALLPVNTYNNALLVLILTSVWENTETFRSGTGSGCVIWWWLHCNP